MLDRKWHVDFPRIKMKVQSLKSARATKIVYKKRIHAMQVLNCV